MTLITTEAQEGFTVQKYVSKTEKKKGMNDRENGVYDMDILLQFLKSYFKDPYNQGTSNSHFVFDSEQLKIPYTSDKAFKEKQENLLNENEEIIRVKVKDHDWLL